MEPIKGQNNPVIVFRPVREDDLDALYKLASEAPDPITTLPTDREYLFHRIHNSLRSFYPVIDNPGSESYLFVVESLTTGELLGASAIFARVGGYKPFYTYEIKQSTQRHKPLHITKQLQELHLKLNHDGPSEIGSLYLSPAARGQGMGSLLSLARFLFVAQFPERFGDEIIAELRGISDDQSRSPFWDAVGQHFFGCDYMTADQHSAKADKSFLQDLMPRHPIYVPLLSKEAQEVIGQVHTNTRPALKMLQQQGFQFINEVDIFDAGPAYKAKTADIHALKNNQRSSLAGVLESSNGSSSMRVLLARVGLNFQCISCSIELEPDGSVRAPQSAIEALSLTKGDPINYLKL